MSENKEDHKLDPSILPELKDNVPTEDNKWVPVGCKKGDMAKPLTEESSFAIVFPTYREKYLKQVWPIVKKDMKVYGILPELDLREGKMTVKTTRKTWDPFSIMKARDYIKLLARSVPVQQAIRIFDDNTFMDIIQIGKKVKNTERFIKRRKRLFGPEGDTLKALELLTGCYIVIQGNTVAAIGSTQGLRQVRKVVLDCMNNYHPVYNIKQLMIKRELMKDPEMKDKNWANYIPQFKKNNAQKKRKKQMKQKKKQRSLFPEAPTPRKVDIELETGEYWLNQRQREREKKRARQERQRENREERKREKEKIYQPPEEQKKKVETEDDFGSTLANLKSKSVKRKKRDYDDVSDYVVSKRRRVE